MKTNEKDNWIKSLFRGIELKVYLIEETKDYVLIKTKTNAQSRHFFYAPSSTGYYILKKFCDLDNYGKPKECIYSCKGRITKLTKLTWERIKNKLSPVESE